MSLAQTLNGVIHHLGRNGPAIRFAACNKAWLKEGKPLPMQRKPFLYKHPAN